MVGLVWFGLVWSVGKWEAGPLVQAGRSTRPDVAAQWERMLAAEASAHHRAVKI